MKKLISVIMAFLVVSSFAFAVVEPTETFYVADYANVIEADTEKYIISMNDSLFASCGAQICVVTVDFTGSSDIDDYAYELFNQWGIGSAEKNNGLLLLLSIGADDYYALQGSGLESRLSSGTLGDLLYEYLEPDFAAKDYNAGVRKVFDAFVNQIEAIYGVSVDSNDSYYVDENYYYYDSYDPYYEAEYTLSPFGFLSTIFDVVIIIAFIIIFILAFASTPSRRIRRSFDPFNRYYYRPYSYYHYTRNVPPFGPNHMRHSPRPGPGPGFSPRPNNFSSRSGGFSSRPGSSGGAGRSSGSMSRSGGGGSSRGGGAGRR